MALHALEHLCLLVFGLAMWAPVVEVLPAPRWFGSALRLGYVLVVRAAMMALGNVLLFSGTGGRMLLLAPIVAGVIGFYLPDVLIYNSGLKRQQAIQLAKVGDHGAGGR